MIPAIVLIAIRPWVEVIARTAQALVGRELSYFPRVRQACGRPISLKEREIIEQIEAVLPPGPPDEESLERLLKHCRETLNEVKELTEYQDQKATRLLTIVAFLSALAGVLFGRLFDSYPLVALLKVDLSPLALTAVVGAYVTFGVFVGSAVAGALVIFHATRTVFKYPPTTDPGNDVTRSRSVLFYAGIVGVTPRQWARTFVTEDAEKSAWRKGVADLYLRSYIVESYLVAAKVADKLRYLQPGQQLLQFAIRMLLVFVLALTCVIALVAPVATKAPALAPTANNPVVSGKRSTPVYTTPMPALSTKPTPSHPEQPTQKSLPPSKGKQTDAPTAQRTHLSGR